MRSWKNKQSNIQRKCLYSRLNGRGGLNELGCQCGSCKEENKKYIFWNWKARQTNDAELRQRRKAKSLFAGHSKWMNEYVPLSNNMSNEKLNHLQNRRTTFKLRESPAPGLKVIYRVHDVDDSYVSIYADSI